MRESRHLLRALWMMGSVLSLPGCGGGEDGGDGPGSGDGTVTEEWAGYCTGIFTEDTLILNPFDEPAFTARAGDEYLLSDFDDTFEGRAEFLYLTDVGPDTFTLEPSTDGEWPFTSNCTIGAGVPYYAAFTDVSVFAEEELTTKICDIAEGSVLPAGSSGRGYGYVSSDGSHTIYEVILGPFSAACDDRDRGYVRVPQTRSFGSTTWLVPIVGLIGPD